MASMNQLKFLLAQCGIEAEPGVTPTFTNDVKIGATPAAGLSVTEKLLTPAGTHGAAVFSAVRKFTENGQGTYSATVALPAGAVLLGVFGTNTAWSAATSAALSVGWSGHLTDIINAADLKDVTTDLSVPAGAGTAFASATTLVLSAVSVGAGTTGRTNLVVLWSVATAVNATKA